MALTLLTANNAQTVLAAGISASATTLTVNTGTGTLFPSPVSGTSYYKLTLIDATTGLLTEIVHVTARSGDTMTITRAQEGTTSRAWSANDIAANMLTAGTMSLLAPLDSPALTGTPTAPTAAAGTNTTQIATMAALLNGMAAFGLGNVGPTLTDLNLATASGFYKHTSTSGNIPLTGAGGLVYHTQYSSSYASQIVISVASGNSALSNRLFTRVLNNGTWGAWVEQTSGRLLNVQRITSSGTYTPTAGTKFIIVEQQAPGGNGANAPATASGYVASGPGGGSGAYAKFKVLISDISSYAITVGTVATASNSATQAGSSSFCGVTCTGGNGTAVASSQTNTTVVQSKGAGGGIVTDAGTTTLTMLIASKGNDGGNSLATISGNALSGTGAPSHLYGSSSSIGGGSGAGVAGVDGSGGSGANSAAYTTSGLTGGQGGNGVTIIWEYA